MLLRKDPVCAEPRTLTLTTHSVAAGVLSSNMGPTGPQSLRQQCSQAALSQSLGGIPPCPLTPGTVAEAGRGGAW